MRDIATVPLSILTALMLANCGGSGGAQSVDVHGVWTGTAQSFELPSDGPVYAAIQEDGYGFAYISGTPGTDTPGNGTFFVLPPIGTSAIGGSVTAIAQVPASNAYTGPAAGTASTTAIDMTFNESPNDEHAPFDCKPACGSLSLKPYVPFTGTASLLPGPWQGYSLHALNGDQPAVSITVSDKGTFTGTDADGCRFTGTVAQLASGSNLFTVTANYCSDPVAYTGLGYESSTDISGKFAAAKGTYFYMGISQPVIAGAPNSSALFSEFKLP